MHIVEILNAYPGETFIGQHATAIASMNKVNLTLGYVQTNKVGELKNTWRGGSNSVALLNANRTSLVNKTWAKLRYLNHPLSYRKFFEKQVQSFKPDIVHFQFASLATRYYQWMNSMGIPYTFSVRGADVQTEPITGGAEYIAKLREAVVGARAVHAVTDDLRNILFKYCGANTKTHVIRTCIDKSWADIKRNPKPGQLLSVGRLHWRKGYPDLIVACKHVKDKGIQFNLKIIGGGADEQRLRYMIRDLNLQENITIEGAKDHAYIKEKFEEAYGYVLSSLYEGFPNVLAEAMLARVPIVTTTLPGVSEILNDSMAFMADVGNPEVLAAGIESLLRSQKDEIKEKTETAYKVAVEEFMPEIHAEKFYKFWNY